MRRNEMNFHFSVIFQHPSRAFDRDEDWCVCLSVCVFVCVFSFVLDDGESFGEVRDTSTLFDDTVVILSQEQLRQVHSSLSICLSVCLFLSVSLYMPLCRCLSLSITLSLFLMMTRSSYYRNN